MKKLSLLLFAIIAVTCTSEKSAEEFDIPYPSDNDLAYYQAECDSGNQEFWIDIKAVTSAFLNNSKYWDQHAGTDNIIILGEGLFHSRVEIEMSGFILEVTLERMFKERGRESIWQVTAVKEKPWPATSSKSDR